MRRSEVNNVVANINNELKREGKLFRVNVVNLIRFSCTDCDAVAMVEWGATDTPLCETCREAREEGINSHLFGQE